jgi:glutamate-5-semialdehyde dehydrogenase
MSLPEQILTIAKQAKLSSQEMAGISGSQRQAAIAAMPAKLVKAKPELQKANIADLENARQSGLEAPLVKRLEITDKIFNYMLNRLEEVAALADPLNRVLEGQIRPNGLNVEKITVPLGVIGIIYESRPNVTTDAASVCLKSGNAVILRGGSESLRTNIVLAEAMIAALVDSGLPENAIQIIKTTGHEAVAELLKQDRYIDVLIPRGGKGLIKRIAEGTRIPVIKHYEGICHLYIAEDAPMKMAIDLALNSKLQRVEVCNALETLLIDAKSAETILPAVLEAFGQKNVEIRGCEQVCKKFPNIKPASEEDWFAEYLAPILSVKIVDGINEAIQHINQYGSGHTDGIVTQDLKLSNQFVAAVDSASVLVNASTRLSGGGDYGMGAVVGISTDKLHARGPVGPNDLTSYKWIAIGNGHLRD